MIKTYEEASKAQRGRKAWGVRLLFPAHGNLAALPLFFGTTSFELFRPSGNLQFQEGIVESPSPVVREQIGSGQDSADFSIENAQNYWYSIIGAYEAVYEDTDVIVYEAIEIEVGVFEGRIIFEGKVEDIQVSDEEQTLEFSCVGDMSHSGFKIGGRILTHRYCGTPFNKQGLLSPLLSPCGWQTTQGGNINECDHTFEGVNGCVAHNNDWRFFAVRGLTSPNTPISVVANPQDPTGGGGIGLPGTGDTGGGTGWGDPYDCFSEKMRIMTVSGEMRAISEIKEGDVIKCFDVKNRNAIVTSEVEKVFKRQAKQLVYLHFKNGEIFETQPNHRFYLGNGIYKPVEELQHGAFTRFYDWKKEKWKFVQVDYVTVSDEVLYVYNLSVKKYRNYFVSNFYSNLSAAVSNLKFRSRYVSLAIDSYSYL